MTPPKDPTFESDNVKENIYGNKNVKCSRAIKA